MPSKDQESDWFTRTHAILSKNGYEAYEVSNFSKPGFECIHNLHYWNIEPYLAFGPSAHGYDGKYRWNNARSLDQYIERVMSGNSPMSMKEEITLLDHINEKIGFGMRMIKGIDLDMIPNEFQKKFKNNIKIIEQRYPDHIQVSDKNFTFTQKGMLFADQLIPEILL
jgi:oxygen-independent coproporphyrinogen-3 oxidase